MTALWTLALWGALTGTESTAADKPETEEGRPRLEEQVEVRVVLGEATSAPLGASSTVIDPDPASGTPSALTELVTAVPGVSENGQAGLFQVVSVRGVSRQRVRSLVSGMRITSERRAGVSTSFIDPTLMGSVQVLRGPATTFHGPGALGGVIEIEPRVFSAWSFATGYDSAGNENYQTAGIGGEDWSVGLARRDADNAKGADGTLLNSHFTQYSAVFRKTWERKGRIYELLAIPTWAEDIGKANTDFPQTTTVYPMERHRLVKFSVGSTSRDWRLRSFVHAHDLETDVFEPGVERSNVFNDTLDLGLRWDDRRGVGERIKLRYGAEGFGRRDVDATEVRRDLSPMAPAGSGTFRTLAGADETELGAYAAARWSDKKTSWEIGSRVSWQSQRNEGGPDRDRTSWSGFAGISRWVGEQLELRASLSSGLRFPSLTERFFTGTTPAGTVIGNPLLDDERALNAEVSARWAGKRTVVGVVGFRNRVEDYVERVEIAPDVRTFVNLTSGTIEGLELQGAARATERWSLTWGGHMIRGDDSAGNPLADLPPDELQLGATYRAGPWRGAAGLALRDARTDPGSGEKPIPSAELLTLCAAYRWAERWEVALSGNNLLDESYFPSADRKAPVASGRSFSVHLTRRGK